MKNRKDKMTISGDNDYVPDIAGRPDVYDSDPPITEAYGLGRDALQMGEKARFGMSVDTEVRPPLVARGPGAVYGISRELGCMGKKNTWDTTLSEDVQPTMSCHGPGYCEKENRVRRLTPTECARLQGFPDWWCSNLETESPSDEEMVFWRKVYKEYADINGGKPKTDAQIKRWLRNPYSEQAEYKMWGNGVALPCAYFILSGIEWCAESESGESSLNVQSVPGQVFESECEPKKTDGVKPLGGGQMSVWDMTE